MADVTYTVAGNVSKKLQDMGDGTHAEVISALPPAADRAAFGEVLTVQPIPKVELIFDYFVNPKTTISRANQSGSVTAADGMAVCSTGAAANSSGVLLSRSHIRYNPGTGIHAKFTALFTTGVADSIQGVGINDNGDGYAFGFDGATYGILHRKGGMPEVRTLTITTKSSTAENITIILDGDSTGDTVAVTNGADKTVTANEIASHDYSDIGRGWSASSRGADVIFTSWAAVSAPGSYSLSAATDAVGSFAQTLLGVAPTDIWIPQASWNGVDKFDGNGSSGVTIDPTKGNVYKISYTYLGFGPVVYLWESPIDGQFKIVHTIKYNNANTMPSLSNPSLPLMMIAENFANTTDLTVKSASMGAYIEGKDGLFGSRWGHEAEITLGATATETPIMSIRSTEVFNGVVNRAEIKILSVGGSADHTKPVALKFYLNPTLVGAVFADVETDVSITEVDTTATSFTGGQLVETMPLGKTGNDRLSFDINDIGQTLEPGDVLTATIAPKSGNAAEATVSFRTIELL